MKTHARRHVLRRRLTMALLLPPFLCGAIGLSSSTAPPASAVALTANWIQLSPTTSPPPRTSASMAYDPANGTMVLFGGEEVTDGSLTMLGDTWTWDGSTWTEQFPASSPSPRYGASLAYDSATDDLVLFGGLSTTGDMADTWTWDGSTWTEQVPITTPPGRNNASMAYDATSANVVLFGGVDNREMLNDTWTWDGATWIQQFPSTKPSARDAASMAYDAGTKETVLFGGITGSASLSDTWTWNGSTWASQSPTQSPSGRYGSAMAYDPATSDMVLFGGYGGGSSDFSDMWMWDGTTWAERFTATSPSARRFAAMDYDAATGTLVLFGGDPGGLTPSSLADTWIWGSEGTFTAFPAAPRILVGSTNTDTAAVTGNVGAETPTGTVTFSTCMQTSPGVQCSAQATPLGNPVAVTANSVDSATAMSPPFVPPAAGTWCFIATYSGDTDYAQVTNNTDGCFVVDPPIATSPTLPTITLAGANTDGATVYGTTAGGDPTGTVSFYVCGPTTTPTSCSSQHDPLGSPVTLTAGADDTATATSPAFTPTSAGDWCFAGDYSGDGTYPPSADTTVDECFSVTPDFTTIPSEASIGLGTTNTDRGTVAGNVAGGTPTGTVSFFACGPEATPAPCTSEIDPVGNPVSVTAGADDTATATSTPFTPTAQGYWCFAGDYSGDSHYAPGADTTTNECFDVVPVAPAFTSGKSATGTAKEALSISITTSGSPTPVITGQYLPKWLVLTDNHNGTATLTTTKARRGKHRFILTATNAASSTTQLFTLTVQKKTAPALISGH